MLLINLMRRYWVQAGIAIAVVAFVAFAGIQHLRLKDDATKLDAAAVLHRSDERRVASLENELTEQNTAITALQTAQKQKEQAVDQALVVAKVQQQKVVTLLAPTENKKPVSCEEAMPDVRNILKGLAQ
jgi:predicted membrane chloride channel (bestrophin family)